MKSLTLTQLRQAIHTIKTSERFLKKATYHPEAWQSHVDLLDQAEAYLTGADVEMPICDPILMLEGLGYEY